MKIIYVFLVFLLFIKCGNYNQEQNIINEFKNNYVEINNYFKFFKSNNDLLSLVRNVNNNTDIEYNINIKNTIDGNIIDDYFFIKSRTYNEELEEFNNINKIICTSGLSLNEFFEFNQVENTHLIIECWKFLCKNNFYAISRFSYFEYSNNIILLIKPSYGIILVNDLKILDNKRYKFQKIIDNYYIIHEI